MILNQANNIMLGNQEVQKVYVGSTLVWQRTAPTGLAPWGTGWNLYGVSPCEYHYLSPGIYLHGFSTGGAYKFTCAESPEKISTTLIKRIRVTHHSTAGAGGLTGGTALLPSTHSTNPGSEIQLSVYQIFSDSSTELILDCRPTGGEQFLLFYSDRNGAINVTNWTAEYYSASNVIDISAETWEKRNYQYPSDSTLTCNTDVPVPTGATGLAVHISMNSGKSTKCCVAFLDSNKNVLEYGDGWQGSSVGNISTHFQSIPTGTAYVAIATGYAPNLTDPIYPNDLKSCILCFD